MTPHPTQLQTLIAAIDSVLGKASPRLPWVMSGEVDQQRRILEQTRDYLAALQQQMTVPSSETSEYMVPALQGGYALSAGNGLPSAGESAQHVLQAVLQEMNYLRTHLMQPMRQDLEIMQQQREKLLQEIQQLEAQRQQVAGSLGSVNQQQVNEFLQTLIARMQETLSAQVSQIAANAALLASADASVGTLPGSAARLLSEASLPPLTPAERLAQMQALQAQSDQLALKLDATLKVFFESLQNNVQSYQESLNNGLNKMHALGQQGEAMFSALINRLAQQLGREASSYLQSAVETDNWEAAPPPLLETSPPQAIAPIADTPPTRLAASELDLPAVEGDASILADQSDSQLDNQIDQLLDELRSDTLRDRQPGRSLQSAPISPASPVVLPTQANLHDLDQLNLELAKLDLEETAPLQNFLDDEDLTFLQTDEPEEITQFQIDEEDLTFLQIDEELGDLTELQGGMNWDTPPSDAEPLNLDAAVELLQQLSVAEAPSNVSATPALPESEPPTETTPIEQLGGKEQFGELDQFYESLFGEEAVVVEPPASVTPPPTDVATLVEALPIEMVEVTGQTLEEQLFGGLADVSDSTAADLQASPELAEENGGAGAIAPSATTTEALTLEDFFFEEPSTPTAPAPETGLAFETLFFPETAAPPEAQLADLPDTALSTKVPPEDVIASLHDLSTLAGGNPAELTPSDLNELTLDAADAITAEDLFEPASPDEDLLATDALPAESKIAVEVGEDTLAQLAQDLSQFEHGLVTEAPLDRAVVEAVPPETRASADFASDDLSALFLPPEAPPEAVPAPPETTGIPPFPVSSSTQDEDLTWLLEPTPAIAPPPPTAEQSTVVEPVASAEPAPEASRGASQAATAGIEAALSPDFLAALLGDAPDATEVLPPSPPPFTIDRPATPPATRHHDQPIPPREDLTLEEYQAIMGLPDATAAQPLDLFSEMEEMLDLPSPSPREDLTLEDYRAVMGITPASAQSPASAPSVDLDTPDFSTSTLQDHFTSEDLFGSAFPVGEEEPASSTNATATSLDALAEAMAAAEKPAAEAIAPPHSATVPPVDAPTSKDVELALEGLFSPEALAQSGTITPDLTLENWIPEFPGVGDSAEPVAPASNQSGSPTTAETAFTLAAIDALFELGEQRPDLQPPDLQPPADGTAAATTADLPPSGPAQEEPETLTLDTLFSGDFGSQASLDLYGDWPLDDSTQKKTP